MKGQIAITDGIACLNTREMRGEDRDESNAPVRSEVGGSVLTPVP
jgi:hypothetical protein